MNGISNSSRGVAHVWTTYSGTKQSWSRVCTTYTQNWMANLLQLGLSSARAEKLSSKKCDIFATLYQNYSGDLTQTFFFKKNFFKNSVVMVDFKVSVCIY